MIHCISSAYCPAIWPQIYRVRNLAKAYVAATALQQLAATSTAQYPSLPCFASLQPLHDSLPRQPLITISITLISTSITLIIIIILVVARCI